LPEVIPYHSSPELPSHSQRQTKRLHSHPPPRTAPHPSPSPPKADDPIHPTHPLQTSFFSSFLQCQSSRLSLQTPPPPSPPLLPDSSLALHNNHIPTNRACHRQPFSSES